MTELKHDRTKTNLPLYYGAVHPTHVKSCDTLDAFKTKLNTLLFIEIYGCD